MGGAKAYFKAKANIAKRDKKFEGIGAAVGALGSIAAITHSKMKTNKEAWEQTERALNIAEEGGYTFEEDILPSEGGNLWERFKGWGKVDLLIPREILQEQVLKEKPSHLIWMKLNWQERQVLHMVAMLKSMISFMIVYMMVELLVSILYNLQWLRKLLLHQNIIGNLDQEKIY